MTGNRSKLNVTTPLESFGLIVTAEPHFLVAAPSPFVVLEHDRIKRGGSRVKVTTVLYSDFERDYTFARGSPEGARETGARVYPHLEEARTAVSLAERASAGRYASNELQRAPAGARSSGS